MRYPPDQKDKSRQKILGSASRLLRRKGIGGVSVAAAMKDAGLSHGAFYAHFPSKDDLVAESVRHAMNETIGRLRDIGSTAIGRSPLEAILDAYLSELHVDKPWGGCAVAQLCQEAARSSPTVRRAMSERIHGMIEFLSKYMPQQTESDRLTAAQGAYAAMVGAIGLAMAMEDRTERIRILKSAKSAILALCSPRRGGH